MYRQSLYFDPGTMGIKLFQFHLKLWSSCHIWCTAASNRYILLKLKCCDKDTHIDNIDSAHKLSNFQHTAFLLQFFFIPYLLGLILRTAQPSLAKWVCDNVTFMLHTLVNIQFYLAQLNIQEIVHNAVIYQNQTILYTISIKSLIVQSLVKNYQAACSQHSTTFLSLSHSPHKIS
jgi:hypothetical protein